LTVRPTTRPIQAGALRRKLRIERAVETQDAYGQAIAAFSTYRTVYGAVRSIKAAERFRSDQIEETITHRITTRFVAGCNSKMRIVDDLGPDDERTFDVVGVWDPDDRRAALVWDCVEVGI
jgi:SPP1 family predicted phage head-tail adaptor